MESRVRSAEIKHEHIPYIYAGPGRETLRFNKREFKPVSPSLFAYRMGDERTHQLINASFLPFFALLSIPPSFN
ncbi:MAG: hypothetical protein WBI18_09255 [Candidatus Saccharicenans sp.]